MPVSGAEGSSKSPPLNGKEKTAKAPRILHPLPPHHTEDPVTMYNKYGILDKEGMIHIFQTPNGYFNPVEPAWPADQQR